MAVETYGNWAANWQSDVIPALHCQTSLFFVDWSINERSGSMTIDDKYLRRVELRQTFSEMCYELPRNEVVLTYDNSDGYFDESPFTDDTFGEGGIECRFYFNDTDKMHPMCFYNPVINRSGTTATITATTEVMSGTDNIHFTIDEAGLGSGIGMRWNSANIGELLEYTNKIGATAITDQTHDQQTITGALLSYGRPDEALQRIIFANNMELLSNRSGDQLFDEAFVARDTKVYEGVVPSAMLTDRDMMEQPEYTKGKKYSYIATNYSKYSPYDFAADGYLKEEVTKTYNYSFAGATVVSDPLGPEQAPGVVRVYRIWIPFADADSTPEYAFAHINPEDVQCNIDKYVTVRGEAGTGLSSPYGVYLWCAAGEEDPSTITGTFVVTFYGKVQAQQLTDMWSVNTGELSTIGGITFNNKYGMPSKERLNALVTNNDTISFTALCDISLEAGDFVIIRTSRLSYICRLLDVRIKYDGGVRLYGKARVVKPFAPVALWAGDNLYLTDKATNA